MLQTLYKILHSYNTIILTVDGLICTALCHVRINNYNLATINNSLYNSNAIMADTLLNKHIHADFSCGYIIINHSMG